ncbi:MAG: nitroreductase family deazaflavin-dependent oxidoreductase [Chitinophagaceae bacterium]|nr:nitroreductase family deazaflavin-dependent oxidoreductase [Anaerolineae bacterium]
MMKLTQYLYLTTTGWKTGKLHEIEIWFVAYEERYYLVAEHREQAHWVKNIMRNPQIRLRVETQSYPGVGRIVDVAAEPELALAVSALMDAKYHWSDGLIVELMPDK